ncbi:hypothetical protein CGRA01v4_01644 [Colletotrichum graminicola]|nr:hypothetical protein CGRA01v4_01644 [Colletotrichum graminicola]
MQLGTLRSPRRGTSGIFLYHRGRYSPYVSAECAIYRA